MANVATPCLTEFFLRVGGGDGVVKVRKIPHIGAPGP